MKLQIKIIMQISQVFLHKSDNMVTQIPAGKNILKVH